MKRYNVHHFLQGGGCPDSLWGINGIFWPPPQLPPPVFPLVMGAKLPVPLAMCTFPLGVREAQAGGEDSLGHRQAAGRLPASRAAGGHPVLCAVGDGPGECHVPVLPERLPGGVRAVAEEVAAGLHPY